LIYTTQKTLTEMGDKVDAATKSDIESRISDLKSAMEGTDIQDIKQKSETLMRASHKLAEQMYAKAGAAGAAGAGAGAGPEEKAKKPEEEVVEAEFEEVK
jgi:molecular chaperone DnaK